MSRARLAAGALLLLLLAAGACVPDTGRPDLRRRGFLAIVAAEDARPDSGGALERLRRGTRLGDPLLRATAVRALGRLESPELLADVTPLLDDPDPVVRAHAADAVAQVLHGSDGEEGLEPLLARGAEEEDPFVRGIVGHALGRLDVEARRLGEVERALTGLTRAGSGQPDLSTLAGVLLGFDDFTRRTGGERRLGTAAAARLREVFFSARVGTGGGEGARVRELALASLSQGRRVDALLVLPAIRDADEMVRVRSVRLAAAFSPDQRSELIRRALLDPSVAVRVEAVRTVAGDPRTPIACARLQAAAGTGQPAPVRLGAIDALALPCPERTAQVRLLREAADALEPGASTEWHVPTRALLSLARLQPASARERLDAFASHESPFVRSRAASAAAILGETGVLERLARDPAANVRTAAVSGLFELRGHAVDPLLREQLGASDPQLVLTAARLLRGTPADPELAREALTAFERLAYDPRSAEPRETTRDPRMALLDLIAETGAAPLAMELEPYLSDFDPRVAGRVAEILTAWTGRAVAAHPRPAARLPLPDPAELEELERTSVLLHMGRGGTIEITLLPLQATTNAYRFARMAEDGMLDGLTFHRVAPNFVIQGGSPGANEYGGHGAYTRDEVGLVSHWRGAVGVSTRGRDTGDGQIFIDLVGNTRLDHDYTVLGLVTSGMDVVDEVLEGDVIERAEVRVRSR